MFITFEGGEGTGKSTQSKLLAEKFESAGKKVVLTREPGGVDTAEEIRKVLVEGVKDKLEPKAEVLLNFAARVEHVEKLIRPALDAGKIVISDRFFDSTYVYQGMGQGVDSEFIDNIRNESIGEFVPNKTFIFDIDPEVALQRAKSRGETNRYEEMGLEFHNKVRAGFLHIANENSSRFTIINAAQSIEEIHKLICSDLSI